MRRVGILIVISTVVFTFWFSSASREVSLVQSNGLLLSLGIITEYDMVNMTFRYIFLANGIRKVAHFGIYGMMGAGMVLAVGHKSRRGLLLIVILAALDEFHQLFIPGVGEPS